MNIEKPKSEKQASIDYSFKWKSIDWKVVKGKVNKLQSRIAKAVSENKWNLVRKLQYLLTKSFYAKLLATKKITSNKGKRTAGVDNELWLTPSQKYKGAIALSNKGYKALPLKRTYIKKSNGKKRPLGIPTIYDRAMQALYTLSLDPVAETILDNTMFGFRKYRSTKDAGEYIFNCIARKTSAKWILEGDIKGCFDNISHKWIIDNIPMNKRMLKQFLKAGFIFKKKLYPTETGTPQGGIISPILANITLNGISKLLKEKYWTNSVGTISRQYNKNKVYCITYADDFIITATSKEVLEDIKNDIEEFLSIRGLELSREKTLITHIDKGFDFLGWNFRKHKNKLLIIPSKNSLNKISKKIRETIRKFCMQKQENLIWKLNSIIRGWCNYHKHICSKKTFQTLDKNVFRALWFWAKRRHSTKSKNWRKDRYWSQTKTRDWIFQTNNTKLIFASDTKIKRHILIKLEANPYFNQYEDYYNKRKTETVCYS